jgi:hypothetical protein
MGGGSVNRKSSGPIRRAATLCRGGSLRREPSSVVESLRSQTLVDGYDALSKRGLFLLTLAIRRQQGVVAQDMIAKVNGEGR